MLMPCPLRARSGRQVTKVKIFLLRYGSGQIFGYSTLAWLFPITQNPVRLRYIVSCNSEQAAFHYSMIFFLMRYLLLLLAFAKIPDEEY